MEFTISSSKLGGVLSAISKAVDSHASTPILQDISIVASGNGVTLTGGGEEVTVSMEITSTACVNSPGSFAVNAQNFTNAIKGLPNQPVMISTTDDGTTVKVDYQQGCFSMPIEDAALYPAQPDLSSDAEALRFSMDARKLGNILNYTLPLASTSPIRPVMCGVFLDCLGSGMNVVASDGLVLARTAVKGVTAPKSCLVMPRKAADLLRTLLFEGDCTVAFNTNLGELRYRNLRLTFRLVEGNYPNYNSVIPDGDRLACEVNRQQLASAIRRLQPFASEASDLIVMNFGEDACTLEATDYDFSKAASEKIWMSLGQPLRIGFKAKYMLSALNCHESENVTLHFQDSTRPMVITGEDDGGFDVLSLCMPMLIQEYEK